LIKRELFTDTSVGLMDEKYFVYFDDTDWMYRASLLQKLLIYTPNVSLYHKISSLTGGGNSDFSISQMTKNRVYFVKKHFTHIFCYFYLIQIFCEPIVRFIFGKYSYSSLKIKYKAFYSGLKMNSFSGNKN
jgi:GT2 family glycosyltransferase